MANNSSSSTIINCSFSGNNAINDGGGIDNYDSSPTIINSILWGDSGSEISNDGSGAPVITYSLVQGLNPAGTGNLDGTNAANNPLFVLQPDYNNAPTIAGNLRLQGSSPVINIGNNAANSTTLDLDANPRKEGTIDMGAYEFQPASATHFFRSISSGNWNAVTTWESSPVADFSSGVISPAALVPGGNASSITVRNPHVVIVTQNATANKLTVNTGATLHVNSGVVFTVQ